MNFSLDGFYFYGFENNHILVHCKTKEESDDFIQKYLKWKEYDETDVKFYTDVYHKFWDIYKEHTVYQIGQNFAFSYRDIRQISASTFYHPIDRIELWETYFHPKKRNLISI